MLSTLKIFLLSHFLIYTKKLGKLISLMLWIFIESTLHTLLIFILDGVVEFVGFLIC